MNRIYKTKRKYLLCIVHGASKRNMIIFSFIVNRGSKTMDLSSSRTNVPLGKIDPEIPTLTSHKHSSSLMISVSSAVKSLETRVAIYEGRAVWHECGLAVH